MNGFWQQQQPCVRPALRARMMLVLVLVTLCCSVGCRRGMFDNSRLKPLEKSEFFRNNASARPLVAHTIPRGHLEEDEHFYTGKHGTNLVEAFPFPITAEALNRGRERFEIYCSVCHGRTGEGNGMIVQRGFPQPPSFQIDRLREAPIGHFFDVITRGYGVMYPYANRVDVADRWAIAAYIRALQLSRHARLENVPAEESKKLEAELQ